LILDISTHDGHDHPLFLSRAPDHEKCSCCAGKGNVLKCADCEFNLDLRCATLPRTVRYRFFEQPFKLCYNSEYDSDGEYYCDICEKERDPKHWFYYCADLSFPAHPDCILGRFPYEEKLASTTYTEEDDDKEWDEEITASTEEDDDNEWDEEVEDDDGETRTP
jgi:hypothetical protein